MTTVIIAKLTYVSSAWWGFTSATDRQYLEAFSHNSDQRGFAPANLPAFADLCSADDEKLFESVIRMFYINFCRLSLKRLNIQCYDLWQDDNYGAKMAVKNFWTFIMPLSPIVLTRSR